MNSAAQRLAAFASQLIPSSVTEYKHQHHIHQLSPTFFLPRAAAIEPEVIVQHRIPFLFSFLNKLQALAVYHTAANQKIVKRTYQQTADRARGLAYYLRHHGYKRVGILAPNTPAFLESIFAIAAASGVNVGQYPNLASLAHI